MLEEYADVLEQTSIGEAYLDCTKSALSEYNQHQYSNIERYASNIKKTIEEQCKLSRVFAFSYINCVYLTDRHY
jgi:nucleotidyltransferase/DNA polymerase involved in DNA repair